MSRVQKKVLPYRTPRETLHAQASVASGPRTGERQHANDVLTLFPAILQSSDLPSAVMGIRYRDLGRRHVLVQ
jgi:hypothetical protein